MYIYIYIIYYICCYAEKGVTRTKYSFVPSDFCCSHVVKENYAIYIFLRENRKGGADNALLFFPFSGFLSNKL